MFYVFVSFLTVFYKWKQLIFILISLEFMVMSLFLMYSQFLNYTMFFYFLCFTVISSVLGIVMMVGNLKIMGMEMSMF